MCIAVGAKELELRLSVSLLEALLLFESSNLVHIDGLELSLCFLLIGRQLVVLDGLQADCGVVTYADDKYTTTLALPLLILFVRERDLDLRDVVGRVGRQLWVLKHGLSIAADIYDT